jgi:hypothetical protein
METSTWFLNTIIIIIIIITIPCIAQNKYNENLLHEHESVKGEKGFPELNYLVGVCSTVF